MINDMTKPQTTTQLNDDEINLGLLVEALIRQKKLIGLIAGTSLLLSGIFAFTRHSIWQGESQIVLENQDSGAGGRLAEIAGSNPILANLAGVGGGGGSQLETEVTILESPSVLKPTFDFVKARKEQQGEKVSNWSFTGWRDGNLDIELENGTSVLNIVYRDTDPDLVLPVIKRIIRDYQRYSGRDRQRGLTQGVGYLEQQVASLREQADLSMRKAQAYALTHELGLEDGMPAAVGSNSAGTSVEANRGQTQQRVNALKQQIYSARQAGNRTVFQAPQLKANAELFSQLQTLEANLQQKQSLLKPNDDSIRRLQRQRQYLIEYINQQTIGLLEGELITAQSQLSSLNRPRDVVLKHRELVRTALRDEKTLTELEVQLQTLQLELARQTEPWELISTPTLLDKPVSPRKKRIVALGLLGGLAIGCVSGLIRDRRSGLVFSEDELKTLLPCPMLERLPAAKAVHWSATAQLLAQGPLAQAQSVALIPVGNLSNNHLEQLRQTLDQALGNRELLVTRDLLNSSNCSTQLLVTSPGGSNRQQLQQLREKLALQAKPLAGWLMIDPALEA